MVFGWIFLGEGLGGRMTLSTTTFLSSKAGTVVERMSVLSAIAWHGISRSKGEGKINTGQNRPNHYFLGLV